MLAVNPDKDFGNVEGISVARVLSLQTMGINGSEFDLPEADCFAPDDIASLSQLIFDLAVSQIEAVLEP